MNWLQKLSYKYQCDQILIVRAPWRWGGFPCRTRCRRPGSGWAGSPAGSRSPPPPSSPRPGLSRPARLLQKSCFELLEQGCNNCHAKIAIGFNWSMMGWREILETLTGSINLSSCVPSCQNYQDQFLLLRGRLALWALCKNWTGSWKIGRTPLLGCRSAGSLFQHLGLRWLWWRWWC